MPDSIWSEKERRAWQWPPDLTPSQWAAAHRHLAPGVSPEPGLWSNPRTPYLAGLMDVVRLPGVEEITFVKPTQVGGSEAARNILGYWIDIDPGPCLWVTPDEKSAREAIDERIRPLIESSPALARHLTGRPWDNKQTKIHLDTMDIYVAWAGSPQTLASRPCRYVILDEVDKYPSWSGREADPISLALERTQTFGHRRRIIKISTPTLRTGAIWRAFESSADKWHNLIPCPHCGHHQRLVFPRVRWPKDLGIKDKHKLAEHIQRNNLAWYECERCNGRIEERHRHRALVGGVWIPDGYDCGPGGVLLKEYHPARSVGLHLSSLYSPWRSFSAVASEFIRADGDPARTMNFRNSWLAEPFELQVAKTTPSVIRDKAIGGPEPRVIPAWAQILIATADTQRDHFYYTLRAWGFEYKSQLVDRGICNSFDELYARTIESTYKIDGTQDQWRAASFLLIDSGGTTSELGVSRTNEVYQFCLRNTAQLFPTKGSSRALDFIVGFHWQKEHGVQLWMVDTEQAKDLLSRLIADPDDKRWMPNRAVDDDYCSQMASEHKVVDYKTKKMSWVPKTSGAPNHYWDCEALQAAAAMYVGAGQPQPNQTAVSPPPIPQLQTAGAAQPQQPGFVQQPGNSFVSGSGWKTKNW